MGLGSATLPALRCPSCRGPFRIVAGTQRHGLSACSCRELVMIDGLILPADSPQGHRLRAALHKHPARRPLRLLLPKSWLRVRSREVSGLRVTFRRYLRHAALARLLSGRVVGEFCHRHAESKLIKPFWSAGQWHLYMQHRFTAPSLLAARAALGLLPGRDGLILDAPCGMGHFSHYLAKMADSGPAGRDRPRPRIGLRGTAVFRPVRRSSPDVGPQQPAAAGGCECRDGLLPGRISLRVRQEGPRRRISPGSAAGRDNRDSASA